MRLYDNLLHISIVFFLERHYYVQSLASTTMMKRPVRRRQQKSFDSFPGCGFFEGRRKNHGRRYTLFATDDDDNEKVKDRDDKEDKEKSKISKDDDDDVVNIDDLPMFSLSYNPDQVDLPLASFTSGIVFFFSTAFTIYLYYIGLTSSIPN
jgi:hypothetical protein